MDISFQDANVADAEKVPQRPICRGGFRHGKAWTREEDAMLRELYPNGGRAPCLLAMPYRTASSVASRIRKLGIKNTTYVHMDEPEDHNGYMRRQDMKFCKAMMAHPEERPTDYVQVQNGAGSRR